MDRGSPAHTGRHGKPEVAPGDEPAVGHRPRHAAPARDTTGDEPVDDEVPERDPLIDTGSVGLRMFNLGTIPASVTPPRTWRRAAWFTVVASIAALAGLVAVGGLLVGPVRDTDRSVAAPYFPDGRPLAAIGGSADPGGHGDAGRRPAPRTPMVNLAGNTSSLSRPVSGYGVDPGPVLPLPTMGPGSVVATLPAISATVGGDPVVDPVQLLKKTRTFFAEVTTNTTAAVQLTTGRAFHDALSLIKHKYGNVASITIQQISLDPTSGLTICRLLVVDKNGVTQTQQIELQFTLSSDPKITNPGG